jgi:hypothetical protein
MWSWWLSRVGLASIGAPNSTSLCAPHKSSHVELNVTRRLGARQPHGRTGSRSARDSRRPPRPRGRLGDGRRRLPSTTRHAIAGTSIPRGIFTASPVSCRLTPTAATTSCTIPHARRDRSPPPSVGPTPAGSSSSWRILRPMPGVAGASWLHEIKPDRYRLIPAAPGLEIRPKTCGASRPPLGAVIIEALSMFEARMTLWCGAWLLGCRSVKVSSSPPK